MQISIYQNSLKIKKKYIVAKLCDLYNFIFAFIYMNYHIYHINKYAFYQTILFHLIFFLLIVMDDLLFIGSILRHFRKLRLNVQFYLDRPYLNLRNMVKLVMAILKLPSYLSLNILYLYIPMAQCYQCGNVVVRNLLVVN